MSIFENIVMSRSEVRKVCTSQFCDVLFEDDFDLIVKDGKCVAKVYATHVEFMNSVKILSTGRACSEGIDFGELYIYATALNHDKASVCESVLAQGQDLVNYAFAVCKCDNGIIFSISDENLRFFREAIIRPEGLYSSGVCFGKGYTVIGMFE